MTEHFEVPTSNRARARVAITLVSLSVLATACSSAADSPAEHVAAGSGAVEANVASPNNPALEPTTSEAETWRLTMHQTSAPRSGCFEASFPSTQWEEVRCEAPPAYRSVLPKITGDLEQVVGNGADYVAQSPSGHVFSSVVGSFPSVTGVTSEKSVGVSAFGNAGILGANEYTVQINTNFYESAACGGNSGCRAWQQYVLSTNAPTSLTSNSLTDKTEVFIEYWLINYGTSSGATCPSGFINGGADQTGPGVDCVQNTPAVAIATGQLSIKALANLKMSASVAKNSTDTATVTYNGKAYTAKVADKLTDISAGWTQAEFNVLGNAGGSRADFNNGSSITVRLAVTDGSTTAPTCIPPSSTAGTTGETNNLTARSCAGTGGSAPYIEFIQSN